MSKKAWRTFYGGTVSTLQKNNLVNKNAMKDKEYNITHNDWGRWANIRLAFIKQHRSQLYQGLLKENKLHSYLAEFDR